MRHIKMFHAALAALAITLAGGYAFAEDTPEVEDPAANWTFTNHWTYGAKVGAGSKPGITDGTFKIRLASAWTGNGCLSIFDNSSTPALSGGPGETIDLRNVMIGGVPVTNIVIGSFAFHNRNTYTNFYINHVTRIGHSVFRDNDVALKKVEIEGSVPYIGTSASDATSYGLFSDCKVLTNVVLRFPECTSIKNGRVFYNCAALPELILEMPKFTAFPDYTFENCKSLTNLVLRCPMLTSIGGYQRNIDKLKHLELSSTNVVSLTGTEGFLDSDQDFVLETLTLGGVVLPQATIDTLLKRVSAVAHTAEQSKKATIYVSKRKEWGWRTSGLISAFAGVEASYAPENCLGVYRAGSRKAWVVHKDSPWDVIRKGFKIIVR